MMFLNSDNTYTFSNATLSIVDNTVINMESVSVTKEIPEFNILIPTYQPIGPTNVMELYWPGDKMRYQANHGTPNAVQYGFGPDFIDMILTASDRVGVYSVNLRGPSATIANVVVYLQYNEEENVAYTDEDGQQYYKSGDGQLTLDYVEGG
ncbi:MAG: hypothetical protein K2F99_03035, partial [Muribaculaceae bacterium]|nr:hypothetical protein [Muribaculaceae bacterium]